MVVWERQKIMNFSRSVTGDPINKKELKYSIRRKCNDNGHGICILWQMGGRKVNIFYNDKTDLLYIRLDDRKQNVMNRRVSEDIVLDIGEEDKIVGIEILDASKHLHLERLLPVEYAIPKEAI